MELNVLIPLVFAVLFLIIDVLMLIRMIILLKKMRDDTAENLGMKINPYLYAAAAASILMAVCMILVTVLK